MRGRPPYGSDNGMSIRAVRSKRSRMSTRATAASYAPNAHATRSGPYALGPPWTLRAQCTGKPASKRSSTMSGRFRRAAACIAWPWRTPAATRRRVAGSCPSQMAARSGEYSGASAVPSRNEAIFAQIKGDPRIASSVAQSPRAAACRVTSATSRAEALSVSLNRAPSCAVTLSDGEVGVRSRVRCLLAFSPQLLDSTHL